MKNYLLTIPDKDEESWEDFKKSFRMKGFRNIDQALMCAAKSFTGQSRTSGAQMMSLSAGSEKDGIIPKPKKHTRDGKPRKRASKNKGGSRG